MKYLVVQLLTVLAVSGGSDNKTNADIYKLEVGKHAFEIKDNNIPGVNRVWYYRPESDGLPHKLMFVIHGMGRNAEDYLDSWVSNADSESLIVIAPV